MEQISLILYLLVFLFLLVFFKSIKFRANVIFYVKFLFYYLFIRKEITLQVKDLSSRILDKKLSSYWWAIYNNKTVTTAEELLKFIENFLSPLKQIEFFGGNKNLNLKNLEKYGKNTSPIDNDFYISYFNKEDGYIQVRNISLENLKEIQVDYKIVKKFRDYCFQNKIEKVKEEDYNNFIKILEKEQ